MARKNPQSHENIHASSVPAANISIFPSGTFTIKNSFHTIKNNKNGVRKVQSNFNIMFLRLLLQVDFFFQTFFPKWPATYPLSVVLGDRNAAKKPEVAVGPTK